MSLRRVNEQIQPYQYHDYIISSLHDCLNLEIQILNIHNTIQSYKIREIINTIHCKVCNVMQYNIKAGENNTVKVVGGNGEEKRGVRKEGREEGTEEGGKEGGRGGIHLSWAPILGEVLSFLQAILFNLHDKLGDCYYQRPLYMCKSG